MPAKKANQVGSSLSRDKVDALANLRVGNIGVFFAHISILSMGFAFSAVITLRIAQKGHG